MCATERWVTVATRAIVQGKTYLYPMPDDAGIVHEDTMYMPYQSEVDVLYTTAVYAVIWVLGGKYAVPMGSLVDIQAVIQLATR